MVEQLYINDTLIELSEGNPIELVYQSPLFTDIDKIVANRTNSISIPLTRNNRKAMRLSGVAESDFAYRKHTARYYRDGLLVFTGYATLLSMAQTTADICLTWGNTTAFQRLFDGNLRELQNDTSLTKRYVGFGTGSGSTDRRYYPEQIIFAEGVVSGTEWKYTHPVMPVEDIMVAIEQHTGISGLSGVFSQYAIPLLTKNTDATANEAQGTRITNAVASTSSNNNVSTANLQSSSALDWLHLLAEDSPIIHIEEYDTITLQVEDLQGSVILSSGGVLNLELSLMATDVEGNNGVKLASIPTQILSDTTTNSLRRVVFQVSNFSAEINVADYSYMVIRVARVYELQNISFPSASIKIIPDINKEQEVAFNETTTYIANYPLYLNLPDWSMSQLVKNLMKLSGLFVYAKSDNEVGFVSVADLYASREVGADWTDRLLDNIEELLPTFGSLAQRNTMTYAEDDTVKGNYSGYLYVNNETLQKESELLSVDFAPTDKKGSNYCIPLYTTNEQGEVEYNDGLTPRVLLYTQQTTLPYEVSFAGLSFKQLARTTYKEYQTTIRTPRVVKASVYVPSLELASFDLSVPVYFAQERHYYAIISMTTKDNNTAEVELLQLGNIGETGLLSTNSEHNKLAVIQNGDGEWITTLPQANSLTVGAVQADDRYKVVLLREGYARRGKAGKKIDRIYGEVGTHTTRKPSYRNYRGGKKLRIIGAEILARGAISDSSKSAKRYYSSSSLVAPLGSALVLPDVRRNSTTGEIIRTESGRISNTSRDGLMNLFVALYYRNDKGKWLRISNTVQVRGLTEGNLNYWEFSEGNIIGN